MAQDLYIVRESDPADRIYAPLAATQTFKIGAPLTLNTGAIQTCPADGTEVLDGELFGFAAEPAAGIHAASRTSAANGFGAATGDRRAVIPANTPQLLLRTSNFWAAAGQVRATPDGANINAPYQLTFNNQAGFNLWGVEETAGVADTDVVCTVIAVLDVNGMPLAIATLTGGVHVVFHPSAVDNLYAPMG